MSTDKQSSGQSGDSRQADQLLTHDYDGIREYDNPTPGWWTMIFLGSTVFAVLYVIFFHLSPLGESLGLTEHALHASAVKKDAEASMSQLGVLTADEATLMRLSVDEFALGKGAAIYASTCIACHRADAGGVVGLGPNLTDEFGKNASTPRGIFDTIFNGIEATAMTAQGPQIGEENSILVAAYVLSLRGTNTPDGIEPEGETMPDWPAFVAGED